MILDVVRTGWMNLRRDRAAMMLSFIVPVVFFSIFAGIFGMQRSSTPKVRVVIVDEDQSTNSKRLIEALTRESALTIVQTPKDSKTPFTAATAENYVRGGSAPIAVVIPKGFGAAPVQFDRSNGSAPTFRLLADSADPIAPQVVSGLLQKTLMTAMPDAMAPAAWRRSTNGAADSLRSSERRSTMMARVPGRLEQRPPGNAAVGAGDSSSTVDDRRRRQQEAHTSWSPCSRRASP